MQCFMGCDVEFILIFFQDFCSFETKKQFCVEWVFSIAVFFGLVMGIVYNRCRYIIYLMFEDVLDGESIYFFGCVFNEGGFVCE